MASLFFTSLHFTHSQLTLESHLVPRQRRSLLRVVPRTSQRRPALARLGRQEGRSSARSKCFPGVKALAQNAQYQTRVAPVQNVPDQARVASGVYFKLEILLNEISENLKCCSKNTYGGSDTFVYKIQKNQIPIWLLNFVGAILQLVQHIKPICQLLCKFSSCSVLGKNMIYNIYMYIYKFQENQRTKKASLSLLFTSLSLHNQRLAFGRQEGKRLSVRSGGFSG